MDVDEVAGEKKQRLSFTNRNRDIESYFSQCAYVRVVLLLYVDCT